jgi:hypothetical protein
VDQGWRSAAQSEVEPKSMIANRHCLGTTIGVATLRSSALGGGEAQTVRGATLHADMACTLDVDI